MDAESMAFMIGIFVGALVAGALCGVAPLVIGIMRGRRFLGVVAMVSCVIAGLLLGFLLAAPVGLVFTIVLLCLPKVVPIEEFAYAEAERRRQIAKQPASPQAPAGSEADEVSGPYGRPEAPDSFVGDRKPVIRYAETESLN